MLLNRLLCPALALASACLLLSAPARAAQPSASPKNMLANPSFELGRDSWRLSKAENTEADFSVQKDDDAPAGIQTALLSIGKVEGWGAQFGQSIEAGEKGKTYTFAVFARSVKEPVTVDLQIERAAKPYDRAAAGAKSVLASDKWSELHVTFTVAKDFPEGWFAYVSCTQPNAQFRLDAARLLEGPYVPYAQAAQQGDGPGSVGLFDTAAQSADPIPPDAFAKKTGWTRIPTDDVAHAFRGDAVLLNGRIALVLRGKQAGAELYSLAPDAAALVALLKPLPDLPRARLAALKITKNAANAVALDAMFEDPDRKAGSIAFTLRPGDPLVESEPRAGVSGLEIAAPCRFAVLPDFFADDIVVDAAGLTGGKVELPSDNFLLHMLPGGSAIVMAVWNVRDENAEVTLSHKGDRPLFASSSIPYGKAGKIWVAALAAPGIWRSLDVKPSDAGKAAPLDWTAPFPAQWRMDFPRPGGLYVLYDSWEMIVEQAQGGYRKLGWLGSGDSTIPPDRKRWTTVLGTFQYPAWIDKTGRGFVQPLKSNALQFSGPAVLYPINRAPKTPLDTFSVIDVVRASLGLGPCEYILDLEGQKQEYKGIATCGFRDRLEPIYAAGQQKQKKAEIEKALLDVVVFVKHIRGRITGYVDFSHDILAYLAEQKKAHPALAAPIADLEKTAAEVDARFERRKDKIKTPADVQKMMDDFRATLLDYDGKDALDKVKRTTRATVEVGSNQDELVGECRWVVKTLRQQAALAAALNPDLAPIAEVIRTRAQKALRNPAGHEGARH